MLGPPPDDGLAILRAAMLNATCMVDAGHAFGLGGHRDDQVAWVVAAEISSPVLNAVRPIRQDSSLVSRIPEILSTYPDHVPVGWWLMPGAGEGELRRALESAGFERAASMPVIAGRIPAELPDPPADLTLAAPATDEDWAAVVEVQSDGFSLEPGLSAAIAGSVRALQDQEVGPPTLEVVVARRGDTAVSVGFVSHRAGVAGLWSLTTRPSARGTGIGSAMLDHRLALARERRAEVAFMYSGGNAGPLYAARGFRSIGDCEVHVLPPRTS